MTWLRARLRYAMSAVRRGVLAAILHSDGLCWIYIRAWDIADEEVT